MHLFHVVRLICCYLMCFSCTYAQTGQFNIEKHDTLPIECELDSFHLAVVPIIHCLPLLGLLCLWSRTLLGFSVLSDFCF